MKSILAAVLLTMATVLPSHSQTDGIIRGVVRGPDGNTLGGQKVVLHRVAGTSGLTIATGTSEPDGSFRLVVTDVDVNADAVYFLAGRYNNELYIGDAFRAPFDTTVQHVVQVGTAETSARNLVSGAVEPPALTETNDPTRWLVFALPALAIAALLAMMTIGRRRIPARRRALMEIAQLDEHAAARPHDSPNDAERARRAQLVAQLERAAEV